MITPQGRQAYAPGRSIASPGDYRISFKRVNGAWKLTGIFSGD